MPTREERERIEREYGDLYPAVCEVLYEEDPIGIGFGDNADEYDPEAFTILPRLAECRSAEELRTVIHEEFVRWFEVETAGPLESYTNAAERIWRLWMARQKLGF